MADEIFDFGLRLRKLREDKQLTPRQLGKLSGLSTATIYRYERNELTPTLESAIKLAASLNVSIDYLVGVDNIPTIRLPNMSQDHVSALKAFLDKIFPSNP